MREEETTEEETPQKEGAIRRALSWCKKNPLKATVAAAVTVGVAVMTAGLSIPAQVGVATATVGAYALSEAGKEVIGEITFEGADLKDRPKKNTVKKNTVNKAKLKLLLKGDDKNNKAEIIKLIGSIYKDKDEEVSKDVYNDIKDYAKNHSFVMQQFGFAEDSKIYDSKTAQAAEVKGRSAVEAAHVADAVAAMKDSSVRGEKGSRAQATPSSSKKEISPKNPTRAN
jgi:hypothetical protein